MVYFNTRDSSPENEGGAKLLGPWCRTRFLGFGPLSHSLLCYSFEPLFLCYNFRGSESHEKAILGSRPGFNQPYCSEISYGMQYLRLTFGYTGHMVWRGCGGGRLRIPASSIRNV